MRRREFILYSAVAAGSCVATPAMAQLRVDVIGVGVNQIPIMIPPLRGEDQSGVSISEIVRFDLKRSGMFSVMTVGTTLDEKSPINYSEWQALGAEALLAGSITPAGNGQYKVQVVLWDIVGNRQKVQESYTASKAGLRMVGHRIADLILEELTGQKGAFASRIAFITKAGSRHELLIAESDGENVQSAFKSNEPIISPTWSPDGNQIAYVSFEQKKPIIYVQEVYTGKRRVVANYKGSNSAPAWAPSGSMLAVLTLSGLSQIYAIDGHGGSPKRLTNTYGIDTQPVYSPDGKSIFFVSDRGGNPQIYRMPAGGGSAERVSYGAGYSVDPAVSPDGRWLAYIARDGGQFRLQVMNLQTGEAQYLTDTSADSKPSFAPNSMMILYATRAGGKETLMSTTLDGQVKTQLSSTSGGVREPVWGAYIPY